MNHLRLKGEWGVVEFFHIEAEPAIRRNKMTQLHRRFPDDKVIMPGYLPTKNFRDQFDSLTNTCYTVGCLASNLAYICSKEGAKL